MKATRTVRINSTCTVFAGAELRDRLALGEKREDIMAGLHRAIILRAMSIISRSGGVRDQFTFTGGVAKNEAAVKELRQLIKENYGDASSTSIRNRSTRGRWALPPSPAARSRIEGRDAMIVTAGIDIGTGAVKTVLFEVDGDKTRWLARRTDRVRQRDPFELADRGLSTRLSKRPSLKPGDVAYVATTGEGESLDFHTGHFYSMTTHGRGAIYLDPEARAALDVGALHGRAIRVDARGKVLSYKMTSQCASGSGQFLENIARYLGIAQDEIGALSQAGRQSRRRSAASAPCSPKPT